MLRIPVDILKQYDTVLKNRAIPLYLRADYTKWLRYYLDFRGKYPLPDSRSEHVRLFIKKLREKNQSQKQQDQAAHALSLFFASEQQKTHDSSSQDQASLPAYSPQATAPHPNREPEAESAVSQREGFALTRAPRGSAWWPRPLLDSHPGARKILASGNIMKTARLSTMRFRTTNSRG